MTTLLLRMFLFGRSVWAVLAALLVGSALIVTAGASPLDAYAALFGGAYFDYYGLASTLVKLSPILLAGLAVAIPLRAGLFNIGAEGQIYLGGLFGAAAALHLPEMPGWLHVPVAMLAGALGGGLWALIPALLKAYRGVNEVIVTLLMNYIGLNLVSYFAGGPMMEEDAPYPYSPEIPEGLILPSLLPGTDAHVGVAVALILALSAWALLNRTPAGFALATVGHNPVAAAYAGIRVRRQWIVAMVAGGAVAGLAGAFEVLGVKHRLFHLFAGGYGYDGIVVAFLASANPLLVPVAAFFLSGLKAGAAIMQRAIGIEATVVEAIQGLVVIFVAAGLALTPQTGWVARALARRRAAEAAAQPAAQGTARGQGAAP